MTKLYKHLFFDLDHTLWDHYTNANETLNDLFSEFELGLLDNVSVHQFQDTFHEINHALWHKYHLGLVDQQFIRKERFRKVLKVLGVDNFAADTELANEYLIRCPQKSNLMPYALEALNYLKKRYPMTIITNGFYEIQEIKLISSGLKIYFDRIITSEQTGWLKPKQEIFDFAVKHANVAKSECLMVGDNPATDIEGARQAGIDQVYYDPSRLKEVPNPTYTIDSLLQLTDLL